ncbi:MAG: hypothetical protein PVSMB2_13250 [Ktedonobacteraceae bacterium]
MHIVPTFKRPRLCLLPHSGIMTGANAVTTILITTEWRSHASPSIVVTALAPVMHVLACTLFDELKGALFIGNTEVKRT